MREPRWIHEVVEGLRHRGISLCTDLIHSGKPWESVAEPEPQYFGTFLEAYDFQMELAEAAAERQIGELRAELQRIREILFHAMEMKESSLEQCDQTALSLSMTASNAIHWRNKRMESAERSLAEARKRVGELRAENQRLIDAWMVDETIVGKDLRPHIHKTIERADTAEVENASLRQRVGELEKALRGTMQWIKDLAESGDAGWFEAKDVKEYVTAELALSPSGVPAETKEAI